MASFFIRNEKMDVRELEEILNLMKKEIGNPKS
jgi:hypothetical protein